MKITRLSSSPPANRRHVMHVFRRTNASNTRASGKLDDVMDLFVSETDTPTSGSDQRRIETQPSPGVNRFGFLNSALNAAQNQLPGRAAASCRRRCRWRGRDQGWYGQNLGS